MVKVKFYLINLKIQYYLKDMIFFLYDNEVGSLSFSDKNTQYKVLSKMQMLKEQKVQMK